MERPRAVRCALHGAGKAWARAARGRTSKKSARLHPASSAISAIVSTRSFCSSLQSLRMCGSSATQSSISAVNLVVEPCEMSASTFERRDAGTLRKTGAGGSAFWASAARERFLAKSFAADMPRHRLGLTCTRSVDHEVATLTQAATMASGRVSLQAHTSSAPSMLHRPTRARIAASAHRCRQRCSS